MFNEIGKLKQEIKWVLGGLLVLGLISGFIPNFPKPADWLVAWTGWIGTIAAIVAGTKFLWSGSEAARKYVLGEGNTGRD